MDLEHCGEDTVLVTADCGRSYRVCVHCDRGINNCTEGFCEHGHTDISSEEEGEHVN